MKPYWVDKLLAFTLLAFMGVAIGCSGWGQQAPADSAENDRSKPPFTSDPAFVVPKGTPMYVRLQQSISSATAQTGESFSAILDEPLVAGGQIVAPEGAPVHGRVVSARESGHLHNSGYLRLTLCSLTVNGKELPLQTSSIFVEGGGYKNRNLAYIGGGAGGGALLGALAGGGKSALIGSGMGAAGGTAAAYATGKKEVGFVAERRLGFRLSQPLNID